MEPSRASSVRQLSHCLEPFADALPLEEPVTTELPKSSNRHSRRISFARQVVIWQRTMENHCVDLLELHRFGQSA